MDETESFVPIQNEDELKEMQLAIKNANAVKEMLDTDGWKNVTKPMIDKRIGELLLMMRKATKYEEFVMIQQAINAIENVMSFLTTTIALGEQASRRIELQNEHDRVPKDE